MNGLCPACRRTYDEQSIEWKNISQEEMKADKELQARKKALARQKESERKNVETLNRKHLAGLRVVQKNLVYVVGLNPKSREQDLLQTLRGDQYFGQYGKIIKIVVSKAKEGVSSNSIGVYVTFARKEDAASCIAAVDGSQNGDRTLRAQFGTTKYCSVFLRNETCNNRSCMFLHETGEDDDSFSRQDLSSMNAESTQRPSQTSASKAPPQVPPVPPQQAPQPVSAASHSMARQGSRDEAMSRSDSGDGSALPSSASWATKNTQNESRRSSKPASVSAPSPVVTSATIASQGAPSTQPVAQSTVHAPPVQGPPSEKVLPAAAPTPKSPDDEETVKFVPRKPSPTPAARALENRMKVVVHSSFKFSFDRSIHSDEMLRDIDSYPLLFDTNRGLSRYRQQKEQEEERLRQEEERNALRTLSISEEDDNPASGSLQLGGEPDTQEDSNPRSGRGSSEPRSAIQPPLASSLLAGNPPFGLGFLGNNPSSLFSSSRSFTPQQQQQLQILRSSSNNQQSPFNSQPPSNFTGNTSMHHHQQSNPFQNQSFANIPGHGRQASRYNFANDGVPSSASSAIKASSNLQQSGVLPPSQTKPFSGQPFQQANIQHQPFYSGVQGPPPGLKSSGTPPVSGGGMFGQGYGFASAMGGSLGLGGSNGASKDTNEEMMRDLLRGRNGNVGGQGHDVGKREFKFPSIPSSSTSNTAPASSLLNSLYGTQLGAYNGYQDHALQKQKKKGKKHRHANTSSSGGGGLVNLADPSILQARMHHGGAGQGQFGVQGQGSRVLSQLQDTGTEDLPVMNKGTNVIGSGAGKVPVKDPAKPDSVPPGLSLPQDFPPLAAPSRPYPPAQKPSQIVTANIKPAVPVLPSTKNQASTNMAKDASTNVMPQGKESTEDPKDISSMEREPISNAESTMDSSTAKSAGTGDVQASQHSSSASDSTIRPAPEESGPISKKASKMTEKRQLPGKLDIAATKGTSKTKVESAAVSSKAQKVPEPSFTSAQVKESADSQPATPTKVTSQAAHSTLTRTDNPRTLRVAPTSKEDQAVKTAVTSPPVPESATTVSTKPPSRRPSLASVQGPGTPISEKISDNASFTSTSLSRANTPPPTRVGTAPVRQATKAQLKRERQARAKEAEKAKAEEEHIKVEEPVQAPIIGRKKKAKKINTSQGTADSTPAATRPSSPKLQEEVIEEKLPSLPATPIKDSKKREMAHSEVDSPATPETPAPIPQNEQPKPLPTAASIIADLQKSGEITAAIENCFKNMASMNYRWEPTPADFENLPLPPLTEDQHRALKKGECLYVELSNGKPVVVMPDGQLMKHLSEKEAKRYIEGRARIMKTPVPFRFLSPADEDMMQLHYPPYTTGGIWPGNSQQPSSSDSSASAAGPGGIDDNIGGLEYMINRFMEDQRPVPPPQQPTMEELNLAAHQREHDLARYGPHYHHHHHHDASSTRYGDQSDLDWPHTLLSVEEAEEALVRARKEHEIFEKKLNAIVKKNRRLLFGGGGGGGGH
ncbi:MAG: hypothetical protein Q9195_007595 [Heterodermia aff. obscurata]